MLSTHHQKWVADTFGVDTTKYPDHDSHGSDHTRVALRLGDTAPEVSEAQKALNIKDTGVFDQATHDAVVAFQSAHGLKVDGVLGPRTLKALHAQHAKPQAAAAAPAAAPGAKPGRLARWMTGAVTAEVADDELVMFVVAEGGTDISGHTAIIAATPEGGRTTTVRIAIGAVQTPATKQMGAIHPVTLENFTQACPAPPRTDGKPNKYAIEASLEAKLGGDVWRGSVTARSVTDMLNEPAKPKQLAHWIAKGAGTADMVEDDLVLFVVADGPTDLSSYSAQVKITPEGGRTRSAHARIGPAQTKATAKQGAVHPVTIENLTQFAPSPLKDGKLHTYTIEATLDAALGGEAWHGTVQVRNMSDILDDYHAQLLKAHWINKGAGTADMVDDDLVLFVVADGSGDLAGQTVPVKVTPEGG